MRQRLHRQKLFVDINITPLTDISLTLLIIFMITTPFIAEMGIKVKLPYAQAGRPLERGSAPSKPQITITAEGLIYLDGKLVTRRELSDKMRAFHGSNPNIGVILRSDRLVRFKDIVAVLDLLSGLGITGFEIAATNQE